MTVRTLRHGLPALAISARLILVLVVTLATAALTASAAFAQWPTTCVELNDIVEAHLGNDQNVGIYQRVFGTDAEAACQNDHRDDVRSVFAWAIGGDESAMQPAPSAPQQRTIYTWPLNTDPIAERKALVEAQGFGNIDTTLFHLDTGLYRGFWGVSGDRRDNFIADLEDVTGRATGLIANEVLVGGSGSSVFRVRQSGTFYLSVNSSGAWVIAIDYAA